MVAYTSSICDRQTRWHFTHGEIIGDMNTFTVTNFRDPKKPVRHHPSEVPLSGHGGGDLRLVREGRVIDYAEFEKRARESANQFV